MSQRQYNHSLDEADKAFKRWCGKNGIPLHGIQHVVTWQHWDDGIGVYFFLNTVAQVEALQACQIDAMKSTYLEFLREFGYPFDKFPNVVFEIDSDEKVRKNFGGNYFNRLR